MKCARTSSTPSQPGQRATRGFGLIEMMIALVLGLVVSGAVVAFIGSIVRANAQTVRVTRLNQELRSVSEMIGRELRRARELSDPMVDVGNPAGGPGHDSSIALTRVSQTCITYGYGGSGQGDFRAIFLDTGDVKLTRGTAAVGCTAVASTPCPPAAASCTKTLNSPLVNISDMQIALAGDRIDITLRGEMRGDTMVSLGDETKTANAATTIHRTYQTSLQVRSTGVP